MVIPMASSNIGDNMMNNSSNNNYGGISSNDNRIMQQQEQQLPLGGVGNTIPTSLWGDNNPGSNANGSNGATNSSWSLTGGSNVW